MKQLNFNDAMQQALGFLIGQTTYIEREVIQTTYPDIQYPQLIPVDTSAPEWAQSITYFSADMTGKAGWFHGSARDIHVADVEREKSEVGVEMADIGYRYTLQELGVASLIPGTNLNADRGVAARRAYEEFIDDVALRGKSEKNFSGIIDYPGITVVDAANGAAVGGPTDWSHKTADEILTDVNTILSGVWSNSLQVEMANTILLPVNAMTLIATKRIPDTTMTVLDFLITKNVYTLQTGQPLVVRAVRGLEIAGTGGAGRMVAYRRDPSVLKMHIPMPHRFLPVWQNGPLNFAVPGIFRTGGLEIRRPGAVRYADGF
jgi:hypothetical protein